MISKELFVESMNELEKAINYQIQLNDFLKDNGSDGYVYQPDCSNSVIKLLENAFNLKPDKVSGYTDVSYFVYELNFGKNYQPGDVRDDDFKEVDFSSAETLYDYLIKAGDKTE
jgi:hypothetical protein